MKHNKPSFERHFGDRDEGWYEQVQTPFTHYPLKFSQIVDKYLARISATTEKLVGIDARLENLFEVSGTTILVHIKQYLLDVLKEAPTRIENDIEPAGEFLCMQRGLSGLIYRLGWSQIRSRLGFW